MKFAAPPPHFRFSLSKARVDSIVQRPAFQDLVSRADLGGVTPLQVALHATSRRISQNRRTAVDALENGRL
jgi:hypothetical protein